MNKIIELQDKRTWTKELKDSIYEQNSFDTVIKKYNIVGYHYTSLINVKDVFKNGLISLNNKGLDRIKDNITRIYPDKAKTINIQFENYIKKHNFDNRKNKIYFCCDNKQLNNGFDYIFKYYGGEITYNVFNNNILGKELLLNIGIPYIIKFVYNFDDLDWFVVDNLKQQIRDKLLKNKDITMDFSMEKDVEVKDIIGIYEVENINNMYHIKRYVNNKNFGNR
jgi:hypothetical protein